MEPTDVDAYWLQRRVSKCFPGMGAQESQALAEQAFAILQVPLAPQKRKGEEKSQLKGAQQVISWHGCPDANPPFKP